MDDVRRLQPVHVFEKLHAWCMRQSLAPDKRGGGVILTGEADSGKSHTAAALIRWCLTARPEVRFRFESVAEMLDQLRPDRAHLGAYTSTQYLVLDDLGRERLNEWAAETLFMVVDARYKRQLPTIVTTELDPDQLVRVFDKATISRLAAGSIGLHLEPLNLRKMAS